MTKIHCSALILSGGMGSRLGFREKSLIKINGKQLLAHVIDKLENVVDEIIISVRDESQGNLLESIFPDFIYAYDIYKNKGPLSGILSGLEVCKHEYCFIAACDMPFINKKIVNLLFFRSKNYDAAIPRKAGDYVEPLHAVYKSRSMMIETKTSLEKNETSILIPISRLHVNYVPFEDIRKIDPDLRTFININTCDDIYRINL